MSENKLGILEAIGEILYRYKEKQPTETCEDGHCIVNEDACSGIVFLARTVTNEMLHSIVKALDEKGYCGQSMEKIHLMIVLYIIDQYVVSTVSVSRESKEEAIYSIICTLLSGNDYSDKEIDVFFKSFDRKHMRGK